MQIRFLRLAKIGIAIVLIAGTIAVVGSVRQQVDAYLPDFSRCRVERLSPGCSSLWDEPDQGVQQLSWTNREGVMMGRATAKTWKKHGRIYYCIEGPIFPETEDPKKSLVVCEAVSFGHQGPTVQQFHRDSARICWYLHGRTVARGKVSKSTYRITEREGSIRFVFWTPQTEPVKNLTFYYQEEGHSAWASMDRPGAPNRTDPRYWNLQ